MISPSFLPQFPQLVTLALLKERLRWTPQHKSSNPLQPHLLSQRWGKHQLPASRTSTGYPPSRYGSVGEEHAWPGSRGLWRTSDETAVQEARQETSPLPRDCAAGQHDLHCAADANGKAFPSRPASAHASSIFPSICAWHTCSCLCVGQYSMIGCLRQRARTAPAACFTLPRGRGVHVPALHPQLKEARWGRGWAGGSSTALSTDGLSLTASSPELLPQGREDAWPC